MEFSLRDEAETDEKEAGTRHELRRRYWAYALELIHKAHENEGSFINVNPSKENWISGFFGVQGFAICCVANFDSCRVELYFGKADKEKNKIAFDNLYVHKSAIENALGVELTWSRNDDAKASKVFYELQGVGIEHEVDWIQAARFHAEWSKKFYDVIVPYLK